MKLTIRPLSTERWPDLEAVFEAKGCSLARNCWCMYYRETGAPKVAAGQTTASARKARLKALAKNGPPPGLLAYLGRKPVGWVTLGPRAEFLKLRKSPVMKPVDEQPVWSIVCFVVPAEYRHQGVATALLTGAVEYAAKNGARNVEAYPIDRTERSKDDWMWHGAMSMYEKAGFAEVARRRPQRPIVRIELDRSTASKQG